jgi:predicted nucleic acid-binding protein
MATNLWLDTNILLDLYDDTRSAFQPTSIYVRNSVESKATLYVNSDTISTMFYILRSRKKVTFHEALTAVEQAIQMCTLVEINTTDSLLAVALCKDDTLPFCDYEDTLQYVCAQKVEATMIVTNDKGFISPDIPIQKTC